MKRFIIILAVSLAFLPLLNSPAFGRTLTDIRPVVTNDHGLNIDLWTDRNQDEIYDVGDAQEIYFRANSDCYVTIYNIDTEGNVEALFPRYPDDGFVYGGMTYRLPDYYDDWDLRMRGPDGIGYLHAVGSRTPNAFNYSVHRNHYHLDVDPVDGDPYVAMNSINNRLIASRHLHAAATVSYFVGRHAWYPRYMCYDCHGRSIRFHPYRDACPRYNVRLTRHYDYWWGYDYHPAFVHFSFGGPFWRFEVRTISAHRHRRYRYLNHAYGYGNFHPIRPMHRSPRTVVYKSKRHHTRRTYAKSYKPVTYRDTRIRRSGNTRTRVAPSGKKSVKSGRSRTSTSGTTRSSGVGTSRNRTSTSTTTRSSGVGTSRNRTSTSGTTRSSAVGTSRNRTSTSGTTRSSGVGTSRSRTSTSTTQSRTRVSTKSASKTVTAPADGTSQRSSTRSKRTSTGKKHVTAPSSRSTRTRSAVSSAPRATPRTNTRSTPSSSSSRGRTLSTGRSSNDDRSTRNSRNSGSSSRTSRSAKQGSRRSR